MTGYQGTMRWFGARFDTPMYAHMPEVPAPIGDACGYCQEEIREGEPGLTMPFVDLCDDGEWRAIQTPIHFECMMRSTIGSPAHLDGECSCHGWVGGESKDSGLTWRQEARLVLEKWWGPGWRESALASGQPTREELA